MKKSECKIGLKVKIVHRMRRFCYTFKRGTIGTITGFGSDKTTPIRVSATINGKKNFWYYRPYDLEIVK